MANTRIINKFGTMTGWNSVTVNIMGRNVEGISALSYNDSMEKENVHGAGAYPVGRSRGNYEAEASMTLFKEELDALKMAIPMGKRLVDIAPFDIVVQYEKDNGQIFKDVIRNAEFTNDGIDASQGDRTLETECELIISHIDWNVI